MENKYPELICPLSYEIMKEPVITNLGISYEKEFIIEWLKTKNICPITNKELYIKDLIPNICLKNLINRLKNNNNIEGKKDINKDEINNKRLELNNKEEYIEILEGNINLIKNEKKFNGYGIYYKNYVKVYEGEIKDNLPDGFGIYYRKNKKKYEGNFKCINLNNLNIDGEGNEYYKNGSLKYKGDLKNSKKNGIGCHYLINEEKNYEGQFYNDKAHGFGTLYIYDHNNKLKNIIKNTFKNGILWKYK